jgi:hypothetical protein
MNNTQELAALVTQAQAGELEAFDALSITGCARRASI